MVILGIDPGSITTGYAFLKKTGSQVQVLEYGTFHANATKNLEDRNWKNDWTITAQTLWRWKVSFLRKM